MGDLYWYGWNLGWIISCERIRSYVVTVLLFRGGGILNTTSGTNKNLYISLFLLTIFGPIYYVWTPVLPWTRWKLSHLEQIIYMSFPLDDLDLSGADRSLIPDL